MVRQQSDGGADKPSDGLPSGAVVALALIVVVCAALAAGVIFSRLGTAQSRLLRASPELMVWAVSQTEREAVRLDHALRAWSPGDPRLLAEVVMRADILISRIDYLQDGSFGVSPDTALQLAPLIAAVTGRLRAIEPMVDALSAVTDPQDVPVAVQPMLAALWETQDAAMQLALVANRLGVAERQDLRSSARRLFDILYWAALGLLASVSLALGAILVQNRALIRARRLAEEIGTALRQKAAEAEAAARAKTTFLATMSEEVRAPMSAVMTAAAALEATALDAAQRGHLRGITASGAALQTLIDDVLDFSRLDAEEAAFALAPFAPAELLEAVAAVAGPLLRPRHVALVAAMDPGMPALLRSDAHRLRQVLVNLVANAARFTRSGGISVTLALDDGADGRSWLTGTVSDSGIGIAPRAMERLFRPFDRIDAGRRGRHRGVGLGLAICRRIVESLGGQIGAESTLGEGSRFWFRVPVGLDSPLPPAPAPRGLACALGTVPPVTGALEMLLRAEGYRLTSVPQPGVLVLAVGTPVLPDGTDVLHLGEGALDWAVTPKRLAAALAACATAGQTSAPAVAEDAPGIESAQRRSLALRLRPEALPQLVAAFWTDLPERLAAAATEPGRMALGETAALLGYAEVAAAAAEGPEPMRCALARAIEADAALLSADTLAAGRDALGIAGLSEAR